LGPNGPYLVHSTARGCTGVEELCAQLLVKLERPEDRSVFTREIERYLGRNAGVQTTIAAGMAMTPAELERLLTALARHVGPIARALIKRAVHGATSAPALWETLSTHIDDPAARAAFLREGSSG
jgi:hypothetical protein